MKSCIEMSPTSEGWTAVETEIAGRGAPLAPLLAGARARGVADGFEWLGLAAILFDDRGEALHVNTRAVDMMGEDMFLIAGRLRARDAVVDAALGAAIRRAVAGGAASSVSVPLGDGRSRIRARVAAMDSLDDDPFQLLRGVAILEWDEEPVRDRDERRH
jgi:hypothetical protein